MPEGGWAGVSRDWSCVPVLVTNPIPLSPIGVTNVTQPVATTLCPGVVTRIFVPVALTGGWGGWFVVLISF